MMIKQALVICLLGMTMLFSSNFALASKPVAAQPAIDPTQIQLNSLTVDQLQQAAEAGDPDAQYALGYMYYYGKRVPQNTAQALNWIKRAAVQGQEQAVKALALLGQPSIQANTPEPNVALNNTAPVNAAPVPLTAAPNAAPTKVGNKNIAKTDPVNTAETSTALISSESLKKAPKNYYTIQLLASTSKNDVMQYSKTHGLEKKATYYRSKKNGKDLYVLVYGLYKTRIEAQAEVAKLPSELRVKNPWVKSVGSIKSAGFIE